MNRSHPTVVRIDYSQTANGRSWNVEVKKRIGAQRGYPQSATSSRRRRPNYISSRGFDNKTVSTIVNNIDVVQPMNLNLYRRNKANLGNFFLKTSPVFRRRQDGAAKPDEEEPESRPQPLEPTLDEFSENDSRPDSQPGSQTSSTESQHHRRNDVVSMSSSPTQSNSSQSLSAMECRISEESVITIPCPLTATVILPNPDQDNESSISQSPDPVVMERLMTDAKRDDIKFWSSELEICQTWNQSNTYRQGQTLSMVFESEHDVDLVVDRNDRQRSPISDGHPSAVGNDNHRQSLPASMTEDSHETLILDQHMNNRLKARRSLVIEVEKCDPVNIIDNDVNDENEPSNAKLPRTAIEADSNPNPEDIEKVETVGVKREQLKTEARIGINVGVTTNKHNQFNLYEYEPDAIIVLLDKQGKRRPPKRKPFDLLNPLVTSVGEGETAAAS